MNNAINLLMSFMMLALTIASSVIEQASSEFTMLMLLATTTFFINSLLELKGE